MLPCLISLLVKPCSRRGRTTWFPAPWVHQLEHRPVTRFWSGQCRLFFYGFGAAEVGIMYWLAITLLAVLETLGAVGCWAFAKCCHRWTVHGKRMQKQAFDWLSGTFNTLYILFNSFQVDAHFLKTCKRSSTFKVEALLMAAPSLNFPGCKQAGFR